MTSKVFRSFHVNVHVCEGERETSQQILKWKECANSGATEMAGKKRWGGGESPKAREEKGGQCASSGSSCNTPGCPQSQGGASWSQSPE